MSAFPPNINFAVSKGDIEQVRHLLANGHCANAKDDDKTTPLHIAAFKGRTDICQLLISKGSKVDAEDYAARTPLFMAQSQGKLDTVIFLLSKKANQNIATIHGDTPLSLAISKKDCVAAKLLINHGAYIASEDTAFKFLGMAVTLGSIGLVKLLIPLCDLKEVEQISSVRPLSLAISFGHLQIAALLLEQGSDISETSSETGETGLHWFLRRIRDGSLPPPSLPFFLKLLELLHAHGFDFGTKCVFPSRGESVTSFNLRKHHLEPQPAVRILEGFSPPGFKELLVMFGSPYKPDGPEFLNFRASDSASLKGLCRSVIRKHLGSRRVIDKVRSLEIPKDLKFYLLYCDMWHDVTIVEKPTIRL